MVLLEYLQRQPLRCVEDSTPQKTLGPSAPVRGYLRYDEGKPARRNSLPSGWGLLSPAATVLKGGMSLVSNTVAALRDGLTEEERLALAKKEEMRQILSLRMKNAVTMKQWQTAARELDILEDNEAWKHDLTSSEYDVELIETRLKQLDDARINCDIKLMMSLVRTALSRDLGGMGSMRLYKHSHIGTKDLIEQYIDSTQATIQALVKLGQHSLPDGLETKDVLEQVVYARQAFGRSALLLSGGATFGMNHVGVLKALFEAKLLPRIISGASAGSIVCAVLCTRIDEEIPEVLEKFPHGDLAVFEEDGNEDGILERVRRLLTQGSWIEIRHLTRVMQDLLGDMTFQEAYNRTRRILNICVSSASVYELPRLLNYVTAPNVMIWSAVAASCSVPILFSAAQLLVKNPVTGEHTPWNPTPQHWIDGSVDNDLPMTRLAEMFNVNHFIVSQVNPHVVPFLVKDDETITKAAQNEETGPGWVYTLTNLAKDEVLHRMQVLAELGVFPNLITKCRSVLSQKYSGDITILPAIDYKDFPRMLKNPTTDFMLQACLCGEKATWPKLSMIRNHCAIELELDAAVQKLRARVVFSPSQVDLRRMTTGSFQNTSRKVCRRDSDAANNATAEEVDRKARKSLSRPPMRTSNSYFGAPIRHLPSLSTTQPYQDSPNSTSRRETPDPFDLPVSSKLLQLEVPATDFSSAAETIFSPPSSDADIDSRTDETSSEPEVGDSPIPGPGFFYTEDDKPIDFFSSSQPVTSPTDHVLATSPLSTRPNMSLTMSPSPISPATRGSIWGSKTAPTSPEFRLKKPFTTPGK
ncbi:acyl transferase/acyl hydrolase/lysophospholipase [Tricladium varicosporioides]|nr:acyl transferase/acyl hydrolase/lysophospholipase [Hymenoscyphus varicosporioides]